MKIIERTKTNASPYDRVTTGYSVTSSKGANGFWRFTVKRITEYGLDHCNTSGAVYDNADIAEKTGCEYIENLWSHPKMNTAPTADATDESEAR